MRCCSRLARAADSERWSDTTATSVSRSVTAGRPSESRTSIVADGAWDAAALIRTRSPVLAPATFTSSISADVGKAFCATRRSNPCALNRAVDAESSCSVTRTTGESEIFGASCADAVVASANGRRRMRMRRWCMAPTNLFGAPAKPLVHGLDVAPVVLLLHNEFVNPVRHGLHAWQQLALFDAVVLHGDRADAEGDVWILERGLHLRQHGRLVRHHELEPLRVHHDFDLGVRARRRDLVDPAHDCLLIEAVAAREVEHHAIGLGRSLDECDTRQGDRGDDQCALHDSSWFTRTSLDSGLSTTVSEWQSEYDLTPPWVIEPEGSDGVNATAQRPRQNVEGVRRGRVEVLGRREMPDGHVRPVRMHFRQMRGEDPR